jgi:ion channel-forming bestrophin family protein
MSEVITAMHVHPQLTVDMMGNLTTFHDILGGCERLIRTPIPLHYTRFTSRFLLLWLAILPMGMWDVIGWATIPATFVMAVLLLGIEEIGVSIEDPFGILALEII